MAEWRLDDEAAEFYEQNFVPALFADWASRLVDAAGVGPGARVLDVACGTGIVARTAAGRAQGGAAISGIDLNASMIKVAQRLRPGIDWRQGDVASMPFANDSFDAVLCQAALMFFPDQVSALQEMRRVLGPGGRVTIQVWGASPGYELIGEGLEKVAGKEAADIFRAPFTLHEPGIVTSLMERAGFPSASFTTHQGAARFPSIEAVLRTEIDGWVLKGRVDIDALLAAVRQGLEQFVQDGGSVSIPIEGHIFTAAKD